MSVNRKFKDFEIKDLLTEADRFKIGTANDVIDRVREAILRWPEFAASAGLPETEMTSIQSQMLVLPSLKVKSVLRRTF